MTGPWVDEGRVTSVTAQGEIEFDRVCKTYPGATMPSVRDLSLRVAAGSICALVGPSGSGKTTALRMINRLIEPSSGEIRIGGVPTQHIAVENLRRSIGYVIQGVGLFPHRTVAQNVATVPELLGWEAHAIRQRSEEVLHMVGLDPTTFGSRYPSQLSGGQRQRVGVARALAARPPVIIMDEPFGAIDPVVRHQIQHEFVALQRQIGATVVIVTHDIDEAIAMGDTVAVLREGGMLEQHDTPERLLAAPASPLVASFLGADATLRRLSLLPLHQIPLIPLDLAAAQGFGLASSVDGRPVQWLNGAPVTLVLPLGTSARAALDSLLRHGAAFAPVVDGSGHAVGIITHQLIASLAASHPHDVLARTDHPPVHREIG